jgi:hypothetical protein
MTRVLGDQNQELFLCLQQCNIFNGLWIETGPNISRASIFENNIERDTPPHVINSLSAPLKVERMD